MFVTAAKQSVNWPTQFVFKAKLFIKLIQIYLISNINCLSIQISSIYHFPSSWTYVRLWVPDQEVPVLPLLCHEHVALLPGDGAEVPGLAPHLLAAAAEVCRHPAPGTSSAQHRITSYSWLLPIVCCSRGPVRVWSLGGSVLCTDILGQELTQFQQIVRRNQT